MKVYKGNILTCDANDTVYKYLVEDGGSLEVGKIADMVILSANPYTTETDKLNQLKVEQLLLAGAPYRPLTTGPVKQILKGIFTK